MRRVLWGVVGLVAVLIGGAVYAEKRQYEAGVTTSIGMIDPNSVTLKPSPIRPDWVLEGRPDTTAAEIARTNDGSTKVFVWRTTTSRFNWFYDFDESVTILDGEIFLTDGANAAPGNKAERRIGPGDVVFFHAGSIATWRVPDHVRKIATMRNPLPSPVASLMRWGKTFKAWMTPASAVASL